MPAEIEATDEIASIHVIPYETIVKAGETVEYRVQGFDKNGRFVRDIEDFTLSPGEGLEGVKIEGNSATTSTEATLPQSGTVTVEAAGIKSSGRIRSFPPLPWKWDFEGLTGTEVPQGWVNGNIKLKPVEIDGNTVMQSVPGPGKPSFTTWIGPPDMKDYVIQADVMVDGRRRLSNVGLTNQRYDFVLKANNNELTLQTWAAHLRINEEQRLEDDPVGEWYTLKFHVKVDGDSTELRGKFWPRGAKEPAEWTITTVDPQVIDHGAPGLYVYRLSEAHFDNVIVSAPE